MRSLTGIVEQNLRPHPKANQNGMERNGTPEKTPTAATAIRPAVEVEAHSERVLSPIETGMQLAIH